MFLVVSPRRLCVNFFSAKCVKIPAMSNCGMLLGRLHNWGQAATLTRAYNGIVVKRSHDFEAAAKPLHNCLILAPRVIIEAICVTDEKIDRLFLM